VEEEDEVELGVSEPSYQIHQGQAEEHIVGRPEGAARLPQIVKELQGDAVRCETVGLVDVQEEDETATLCFATYMTESN